MNEKTSQKETLNKLKKNIFEKKELKSAVRVLDRNRTFGDFF